MLRKALKISRPLSLVSGEVPRFHGGSLWHASPDTIVHSVATVTNQALSFGRGLPVARASPMQIGTPAASASPMQVSMLAASLHRIPGHRFAAEDALLVGATLACSPW